MNLGCVPCPGCKTKVDLTSRVLDDIGAKVQPIVPSHNPPANNPMGLPVDETCPGSGQSIGNVLERQRWR